MRKKNLKKFKRPMKFSPMNLKGLHMISMVMQEPLGSIQALQMDIQILVEHHLIWEIYSTVFLVGLGAILGLISEDNVDRGKILVLI